MWCFAWGDAFFYARASLTSASRFYRYFSPQPEIHPNRIHFCTTVLNPPLTCFFGFFSTVHLQRGLFSDVGIIDPRWSAPTLVAGIDLRCYPVHHSPYIDLLSYHPLQTLVGHHCTMRFQKKRAQNVQLWTLVSPRIFIEKSWNFVQVKIGLKKILSQKEFFFRKRTFCTNTPK